MKSNSYKIIVAILILTANSCSLEPQLKDKMVVESVTTVSELKTLIDGTYKAMTAKGYYGRNFILAGEIRADNVFSNENTRRFGDWSRMEVINTETRFEDLMQDMYITTSNPNVIINSDFEKIQAIDKNEENDKNHIIGEAYAIRAITHFDLLRLFGQQYSEGYKLGITYMLEFKAENLNIPRSSLEDTKKQIYADIDKAIEFLKIGIDSKYEYSKLNMTLDGAYALKSRIGTYYKDYDIVREVSLRLINNYSITPSSNVVEYWAESTPGEASIFELFRSDNENLGGSGLGNIYRGSGYADIEVFANILKDAEFDEDDARASKEMINIDNKGKMRNMGKYPDTDKSSDNIKVFRIEEVVLNYAEALIETDPSNALEYLNSIPKNRGLGTNYYSEANTDNILKERRKEFIFEGFRLYDLARHGRDIREVDPASINNHGLIPAGDYRFAMPIAQREMDSNSSTEQNPGY